MFQERDTNPPNSTIIHPRLVLRFRPTLSLKSSSILTATKGALECHVDALEKQVEELNHGVAMSFAISAIPQAYREGSTLFGAGVGNFNSANALAIGISHKMNDRSFTVNVKLAAYGSEAGTAVGIGYVF